MNPKIAKQILKNTQRTYNQAGFEFSKKRKSTWQKMQFLFNDYLRVGDRVLDLGCGNGRFYKTFKKHGVNYTGLDNSKTLIKIAKNKNPSAKFILGNGLNLPFQDSSFNKIYAIAVLHHIPSRALREKFLLECRHVLKKDGLLILTNWNLWPLKKWKIIKSFLRIILKILGISKMDFRDIKIPFVNSAKCYFHCFSKRELKNSVAKAGFKIQKAGFVGWRNRKNANIYLVSQK